MIVEVGSYVRFTDDAMRADVCLRFLRGERYLVTSVGKRTVVLVHERNVRTRSRGSVYMRDLVEVA